MHAQVHKFSRRQWAALLAEALGLAIFQLYGGSANDEVAAFGNGITLAVLSEHPCLFCCLCDAMDMLLAGTCRSHGQGRGHKKYSTHWWSLLAAPLALTSAACLAAQLLSRNVQTSLTP